MLALAFISQAMFWGAVLGLTLSGMCNGVWLAASGEFMPFSKTIAPVLFFASAGAALAFLVASLHS